jgi:AAA15 family ATPase/GTPase
MFVGINEVGKSNILQAMSFLENMKTKIAVDFSPTVAGLNGDLYLLKSVVQKIVEQLGLGTE